MQCLSKIKDLGVLLDPGLYFKEHINEVLVDASKALGFVIRSVANFHSLDVIIKLYNAIVRSKLEYAAVVWNPYFLSYIHEIEMIQNKFLRYLYYKSFSELCPRNFPTVALRRMYSFISLQTRRDTFSLLIIYKIFNNLIDIPDVLQFIHFYVPHNRARPNSLFYIPKTRTIHRDNSFFVRSLRLLNNMNLVLDPFCSSHSKFREKCYELLAR